MKKYFKHKLENLLLVNRIVTIHYFEFDKNFKFHEESHDFWEIVFADKENINVTWDGKEVYLKQGELLFHKPNVSHSLYADGQNAPNVIIISFVCRSDSMHFFDDRIIKLNKKQVKYLYSIMDEAKRTFDIPYSDPETKKMTLLTHPTLGGQQLIKNQLELLLIEIMRSLTETEYGNKIFLSDNEFGNKFTADVIKIMKNNITNNLSIDDIVKATSYSKAYIFKQFKLATGKSVMDYFINLKINYAKELLGENDLTVKEIAEKLAFDTPNYFTKTFKKFTGLTPTEYKKRISV